MDMPPIKYPENNGDSEFGQSGVRGRTVKSPAYFFPRRAALAERDAVTSFRMRSERRNQCGAKRAAATRSTISRTGGPVMPTTTYPDRTSQKDRMARGRPRRRFRHVVGEGIVVGVVGAAVAVGGCLIGGGAAGVPLRTPAMLGAALFHGARSAGEVAITAPLVLGYTVVHLGGFVLFGLAVSGLFALAGRGGGGVPRAARAGLPGRAPRRLRAVRARRLGSFRARRARQAGAGADLHAGLLPGRRLHRAGLRAVTVDARGHDAVGLPVRPRPGGRRGGRGSRLLPPPPSSPVPDLRRVAGVRSCITTFSGPRAPPRAP